MILMSFALQATIGFLVAVGILSHSFSPGNGHEVLGYNRFDTKVLYDVSRHPELLDKDGWSTLKPDLKQFRDDVLKEFGDQSVAEAFGAVLNEQLWTPDGKWFNPRYHAQLGIDMSSDVKTFLEKDLGRSALILARTIEVCNRKPMNCTNAPQ